jgi:hypothetical protein
MKPNRKAYLNCMNQYSRKSRLSRKMKGNARPKKAGGQNKTGGMYLAAMAIIKATMLM